MTEQAQIKIGMPPAWLAELLQEMEIRNCEAIAGYSLLDDRDQEMDETGLKLMIGGEEVNWAKLLFEATVSGGVGLFLQAVVDTVKDIYKKHIASGRKAPDFIEYIRPDGRRVRIYGRDLE